MDGYCDACASNRCDCYPDECPVKYPPSGPSSERTADALRARLVLVVGNNEPDPDMAWAILNEWDRLVARNQQLQEALERIASGDINWQACKAEARAALASVRARTP